MNNINISITFIICKRYKLFILSKYADNFYNLSIEIGITILVGIFKILGATKERTFAHYICNGYFMYSELDTFQWCI